jgi:hypothetical protein
VGAAARRVPLYTCGCRMLEACRVPEAMMTRRSGRLVGAPRSGARRSVWRAGRSREGGPCNTGLPLSANERCSAGSRLARDLSGLSLRLFINATAFSPTDTMPLTRWAKDVHAGRLPRPRTHWPRASASGASWRSSTISKVRTPGVELGGISQVGGEDLESQSHGLHLPVTARR